MTQSKSMLHGLIDIYIDPKRALTGADERKGWTLLPLLIVLAIPMAVIAYYYGTLDINWFADRLIASSEGEMPPEARQYITRSILLVGGLVGQLVIIPAILAASGLYLHLVAKMTSPDERKFGAWFRLAIWTSMPSLVLAQLAVLINYILAGTPQFGPEQLNFFSANALFAKIPMEQPGFGLMEAITPFMFWSIALTALGLQLWTKRTFTKSLMIAAAPYVVVFGIWALVVFG